MSLEDIVAVLLVAVHDDPGGLIGYGPCRSLPPWVHKSYGYRWSAQPNYPLAHGGIVALPLWWEGKPILAGWDQALRLLPVDEGNDVDQRSPTLEATICQARRFIGTGMSARVVFLVHPSDTYGQAELDVDLVEIEAGGLDGDEHR